MKKQSVKTQSISIVRARDRVFFWELARRGFAYYRKSNILFAAGCAVGAAALCGALLAGASLKQSVRELHRQRLGEIRWALVSPSGYFQSSIADSISASLPVKTAPVIMTAGSAEAASGGESVRRVNIIGTDERFAELGPSQTRASGVFDGGAQNAAAAVNAALSKKLDVGEGDEIVLRFQKTGGQAAAGTPDGAATLKLRVASIINAKQFGDFSLKTEHFAVYNVFVPINLLQSINGASGRASAVLVSKPFGKLIGDPDSPPTSGFKFSLDLDEGLIPVAPEHILYVTQNSLSVGDAGLRIRVADMSGDTADDTAAVDRGADFEIYSDRVFINEPLTKAIAGVIPQAVPIPAPPDSSISAAIRVPRDASVFGSVNVIHSAGDFERAVLSSLTPALCGMQLTDIRAAVDGAVNDGVDFAPLFLGLSFFMFAASLLFIRLLSTLQVKSRADERKALRAAGYSRKHIMSVCLTESVITFSAGTAAGIIISPLYTLIIIGGLKTVWRAAAQMPALSLHLDLRSILIGGVATFLCATAAQLAPVWGAAGKDAVTRVKWTRGRRPWIAGCLKIVKIVAEHQWIEPWLTKLQLTDFTMRRLAMLGAFRSKKMFVAEAAILACALFILGSTRMFHQHAQTDPRDAASGTGGFVYYGKFNHGVPSDQTDAQFLRRRGVGVNERGIDYIPLNIRMREGDNASSLNINKAAAPTLLGVDQKLLDGRGAFSFTSVIRNADKSHPWQILGTSTGGANVIYGAVDAHTLARGVKKVVGDTLPYINDAGDTLRVVIAAALDRSALQGKVIIAEEDFVRHYPSTYGYRALLLATTPEHEQAVADALNSFHAQNGLILESTVERIAAFNAVENAYLSIFVMLGILGLIVGCAGMGIIVLRSIEERRGELAMLMALGFSAAQLKRLLFTEHAVIALIGTAAGLLSALAVSIAASGTAPVLRCVCLLLTVSACGACSIMLGLRSFNRENIMAALREDG